MRGCFCREPVGDPAENCADRDVGPLLGEDLGERPGGGRGNLEGHLVGFELGDRFVGGDRFARPLQPLRDGRLGDRFTEARDLDFGRHEFLRRQRLGDEVRLLLDMPLEEAGRGRSRLRAAGKARPL